MKAKITSTDRVVDINAIGFPGKTKARVWEGETDSGVRFTAYIPLLQVAHQDDNSQFERELTEHKQPDAMTNRAIDMRFFVD